MRLGLMLTEYTKTDQPKTNALIALMCFHASRFNARQQNDPNISRLILYDEQNKDLWDQSLINQGWHFLNISAHGSELTSYHLEARIASWHCVKEDSKEKWHDILRLYDQLLLVNYSPSVALHRVFALYKANEELPRNQGRQIALHEAEKLKFENNHFYFLLLGELYKSIDNNKAKINLKRPTRWLKPN